MLSSLRLNVFDAKQNDASELKKAVAEVFVGRRYISPSFTQRVKSLGPDKSALFLSLKQQRMLMMFGDGSSDASIAEKLKMNPATVGTHRKRILRQLNLHGSIDLMKFSLRHGLCVVGEDGVIRPVDQIGPKLVLGL